MELNVLVVDDCPIMRLIIKRTLNFCGIELGEIIEAGNGDEALDWIEKINFDFIIADLNMPVMSGAEMLAHIKQDPKACKIPILTVSAESNKAKLDIVSAFSSDFLHKPFAVEELRDKILMLLDESPITIPEHS